MLVENCVMEVLVNDGNSACRDINSINCKARTRPMAAVTPDDLYFS